MYLENVPHWWDWVLELLLFIHYIQEAKAKTEFFDILVDTKTGSSLQNNKGRFKNGLGIQFLMVAVREDLKLGLLY